MLHARNIIHAVVTPLGKVLADGERNNAQVERPKDQDDLGERISTSTSQHAKWHGNQHIKDECDLFQLLSISLLLSDHLVLF